jgi:uncharacterized protein YndB with AHSA1/START domain
MNRAWKLAIAVVFVAALLVAALFVPVELGSTRIVSEVDIARSPPEVFAYVTTPGHWPQWHPSSLAVSGAVDHPLEIGETVVEDFEVAGRRGRVTWRVTAREPDRLWRIAGNIDGRESGTVSYSLAPATTGTGTGTHFVREFEYRTPSLLFALLNRISLRSRIEAESAQAVRQLKERLESAGEPAQRSG